MPSPSTSPKVRSDSPDTVVIEEDTEQQLVREEITRRLLGVSAKYGQIPESAGKVPANLQVLNNQVVLPQANTNINLTGKLVEILKEGTWRTCKGLRRKSKNIFYVCWGIPEETQTSAPEVDAEKLKRKSIRKHAITFFGSKAVQWRELSL